MNGIPVITRTGYIEAAGDIWQHKIPALHAGLTQTGCGAGAVKLWGEFL